MTDEKVVLRFRDGRTERVTLDPIDASREMLTVHHDEGDSTEVPFSELKAVFFPQVRDGHPVEPAAGLHIAVEFNDGEIIQGMAHYNPERNGFFLFPQDRSKNDRIFVVNSAIASIEVT